MNKEFQQFKLAYRKTIKISLVISLAFLLILLHIVPKNVEHKKKALPVVPFSFEIEEVPATTQQVRRGVRPQKPAIPVPSEDPDIPQDATIEETIIDWDIGDSPFGVSGLTTGRPDTIPPRPIVQVLPEYPRELVKQNVRGIVKLMLWVNEKGRVEEAVVVENSTNNEKCAQAALEAAKKNSYLPATIDKKKVASWVACTYSFKPE